MKKWMLHSIFLCLTHMGVVTCYGQNYITKINTFSVEDGLSNIMITDFIKDSRGFIWIATKEGINRFDGTDFKVFMREDMEEHSSYCNELHEDVNGNIWGRFFDQRGKEQDSRYAFLIDQNFQIHKIDDLLGEKMPFKSEEIESIATKKDKTLYILTKDGTVYIYDGTFQMVISSADFQKGQILKVLQDGTFYLKIQEPILKISKEGQILEEIRKPSGGGLKEVVELRNFEFYKSLWLNGFYESFSITMSTKFVKEIIREPYSNILKEARGLSFFLHKENEQNFIWARAVNYLVVFDENGEMVYDFSPAINNEVKDLWAGDSQMRIGNQFWFNYYDGIGILNFKPNPFQHLYKKESASSTRGILELSNGNLLIVAYGGIKIFNPGTGEELEQLALPFQSGYRGVVESSDGNLIFGGYGSNISVYDQKTKSAKVVYLREEDKAIVPSKGFLIPFIDSKGKIWIGTRSGLVIYDPSQKFLEAFKGYNDYKDLQNQVVNYFQEREDGIWIGTSNGMYVLDSDKGIIAYHSIIPNAEIYHFHREGDIFWIATYGKGLIKWNKETNEIKRFDSNDGMLDDHLMAVYPDKEESLWITSEMGLIRFNKPEETFNTFLESDGITHNEFNRASHFQAEDGKLYFGGLNGVNAFYPEHIRIEEDEEAPFRITEFYELDHMEGIFEDKTPAFLSNQRIKLSTEIKAVRVHFALLNYENVEQTSYAYKIEGYDQDWTRIKENSIRINHLPGGDYTLKIKAQSYTGKWSPNEITVPIQVVLPFYEQFAWQFFGAGILSLIFYIVYRWRLGQSERIQRRLKKLVDHRTAIIEQQKEELVKLNDTKDRLFSIIAHDLKNPVIAFKGLSSKIQFLLQKKEEKRVLDLSEYVEKEAQYLHDLLDNLLNWALTQRNELNINLTSVPIYEIADNISKDYLHLVYASRVQLINEVRPGIHVMADRTILETIFRNLISNAFRYTRAGEHIRISAKEEDHTVQIIIEDNGMGMNKKELNTLFDLKVMNKPTFKASNVSFGLHLCKELIELLNGTIKVKSEANKGSTFILTLEKGA